MADQKISKKSAQSIAFALFLIGIGILYFVGYWWPGIMLVIGIPLAFKQWLLGRYWDMGISLLVFLGVFITVQFEIPWKLLLPLLFTLGGLYILFREFFGGKSEDEAELEEDINHEIEEQEKKKKK